jgi:hypothetical protein
MQIIGSLVELFFQDLMNEDATFEQQIKSLQIGRIFTNQYH